MYLFVIQISIAIRLPALRLLPQLTRVLSLRAKEQPGK